MDAFHELPVAAWRASPEGRLLDVNPAACALLGYDRDTLCTLRFDDLVHPDAPCGVATLVAGAGTGPRIHRCRLVRADGRLVHVELRCRTTASGEVLVVVEDRAHLAEAEVQLVQREQEFRAIFEQAASGEVLLDPSGRFLRVNRAFVELSGRTRGELLAGMQLSDVVHPDDRARKEAALAAVVRGDLDDFRLESRILRPDGTERWVLFAAAALGEPRGAVLNTVVTITDITVRRRAEEDLRNNEALLRLAQRAAHAGVWVFDTASGRATLSPEAHVLHGTHGLSEPTVQDWLAAVHPDDRDRVRRGLQAALRDRVEFDEEFRVVGRDGRVRWLWNLGRAEEGPENPAQRVRGIALDVTERKEAERRLRQSEETWRTLAVAVPDALWIGDHDGRPELTNPRWTAYTGLGPEAVASWMDPCHPDERDHVAQLWASAVASRHPFECELRYRRHDGEHRWFLARAVPVTSGGEVLRWVGTLTDIDERRRAEDILKETARRKDEFLAILSHELRNPLAPIRTGLQVLQQVALDSAQARRTLTIIERQARHLTRLVDDLLDTTRVTRGKVSLQRRPIDLVELIRTSAEDLRPSFERSELELELELPDEALVCAVDEVRMAQIVGNLVHNALKFTPPGGRVRLGLAREGDLAVLTVADTGIGIAPDLLPVLFEPFTQADATLDRSKGGLGLGLALVRGLVELHGGEVTASSPGCGAEVVVRLPLAGAAAPVG